MYVHDRLIDEEIDFHTTKIRRAFRHSIPFLKDFWEPVSIGVKVVLLVEDDTTGKHLYPYIESRTLRVYTYVHYGQVNEEMDFRIIEN